MTGKPGQTQCESRQRDEARRKFAPTCALQDAKKRERKPCCRLQHSQLQRRITGRIAAVADDHRSRQRRQVTQFTSQGQPPHEGIHEQGVEQHMSGHFHLQRIIGPATAQCAERDSNPARGVENGRLRVGDKGQSAIVVGIP